MRIVIFGNGLIGRQAAAALQGAGHDVLALGREAGIDTTTGAGVAGAVAGAEVVVDLTNSPSCADDDVLEFFQDSTRHLLDAERVAGVGHHVILSIVGADRLPAAGYLRAKVAQEELVKGGPVPYSIVRSTQFFEFIAGLADAGTRGNTVHATPAHLQPIASHDVVSYLADVITSPPLNTTVEIAGPQPKGLDDLIRDLFAATGDERLVTTDPEAGYAGGMPDDATLIPTPGADAWIAPTTLLAWLDGHR